MKKINFIVVLILFFNTEQLFSQSYSPQKQAVVFTKNLKRELNLTKEQTIKVQDLMTNSFVEADKLRNDLNIPKEQRKILLQNNYSKRKMDLNEILTSDQKTRYKEYELSKKSK